MNGRFKRIVIRLMAVLLLFSFPAAMAEGPLDHVVIVHAMGAIDGRNYSNCLEAFEKHYARGHRIFEVDFIYTSDDALVLWHNWKYNPVNSSHTDKKAPTLAEFKSMKVFDSYTSLTYEDLLDLMMKYPDITIVTDTKYTSKKTVTNEFNLMVKTAEMRGAGACLDRMVIQLYNRDMLDVVRSIYPFKNYIFTLYSLFDKAPTVKQFTEIAEFCRDNGIGMITMKGKWWSKDFEPIANSCGVQIGVHTIDSEKNASRYYAEGVEAVYSNTLPPYGFWAIERGSY